MYVDIKSVPLLCASGGRACVVLDARDGVYQELRNFKTDFSILNRVHFTMTNCYDENIFCQKTTIANLQHDHNV